jgi:hypothetical protein
MLAVFPWQLSVGTDRAEFLTCMVLAGERGAPLPAKPRLRT